MRSENKKEGYGFNRIRMSLSISFKNKIEVELQKWEVNTDTSHFFCLKLNKKKKSVIMRTDLFLYASN